MCGLIACVDKRIILMPKIVSMETKLRWWGIISMWWFIRAKLVDMSLSDGKDQLIVYSYHIARADDH